MRALRVHQTASVGSVSSYNMVGQRLRYLPRSLSLSLLLLRPLLRLLLRFLLLFLCLGLLLFLCFLCFSLCFFLPAAAACTMRSASSTVKLAAGASLPPESLHHSTAQDSTSFRLNTPEVVYKHIPIHHIPAFVSRSTTACCCCCCSSCSKAPSHAETLINSLSSLPCNQLTA